MPITTPEQLALAERVRDHIKAHPQQHEMEYYFCGTSACTAGWTAILGGAEPVIHKNALNGIGRLVRTPGGLKMWAGDYASAKLGLSTSEAEQLFYGSKGQSLAFLDQLIADGRARIGATA